MSVPLNGCKFEHTEPLIHFESFYDERTTVKEAKDANMLSHDSKLTPANLQLNWCPSKSTIHVLKWIPFSIPLSKSAAMNFQGHT